jgi:hypothetical protein
MPVAGCSVGFHMTNVEAKRAIWLVIVSTPAPVKYTVILAANASIGGLERFAAVLDTKTTTRNTKPTIMRRPVLACNSLAPDRSISPAFLLNSCRPAPSTCRIMTREHAMTMAYLTTEVMMLLVQSEDRRSNKRTSRFVRRKFTANRLTLLWVFTRQLNLNCFYPKVWGRLITRGLGLRPDLAYIPKTYPILSDTRARKITTGLSVLDHARRKMQTNASERQKLIMSAATGSLSPRALRPLAGRLAFFRYTHA